MPKTSRLEYINLNENRAGFEIAALESTQGYLGINKVKKTYEVSIIIETLGNKSVIWVDVFKGWIEDNDLAFDKKLTKMFHNIKDACKYIEKQFGLHPKTKAKLLTYKRKNHVKN